MHGILEAIDWFLNTSEEYQVKEPTRRRELIALVEREIEDCQSEGVRTQLEARRERLEHP